MSTPSLHPDWHAGVGGPVWTPKLIAHLLPPHPHLLSSPWCGPQDLPSTPWPLDKVSEDARAPSQCPTLCLPSVTPHRGPPFLKLISRLDPPFTPQIPPGTPWAAHPGWPGCPDPHLRVRWATGSSPPRGPCPSWASITWGQNQAGSVGPLKLLGSLGSHGPQRHQSGALHTSCHTSRRSPGAT